MSGSPPAQASTSSLPQQQPVFPPTDIRHSIETNRAGLSRQDWMVAGSHQLKHDSQYPAEPSPLYDDSRTLDVQDGQEDRNDSASQGLLPRMASLNVNTLSGAYWRLATEASNTVSTRMLENQQSGTLKERKRAYYRAAAVNIALILSWYLFATLISVYNKWMFSEDRHNFSFPLFVTSCHMVMQFILSSLLLSICGDRLVPRLANGTRPRPSGSDWLSKVVPCALATALDIGLSNSSLKTITLTFYTMCKSSNLAFVLFFAFLFRLEVIRWSLIGIISIITIGVVMMVAAETKFVLIGAVEVLTASAMGGLRWALTQMLLDREGMGINNPVATIFWLAPIMFISLISFSGVFEDWHAMFGSEAGWFNGLGTSLQTLGLIAIPGVLAFGMNLSEFALIKRTSVVTLSVAGIFKEVITIMVASSIFGDQLTPINITGLCITLFGIGLYNWLKYRLITMGANAVGQEIAGLSELNESIRSRASSVLHGMTGHYHPPLSQTRAGSSGGYQPVGEGHDEDVLFDKEEEQRLKPPTYGGGSTALDEGEADAVELDTQRVSHDILRMTQEEQQHRERERKRRIEEEANLEGWSQSGIKMTGNGLVEGHDVE